MNVLLDFVVCGPGARMCGGGGGISKIFGGGDNQGSRRHHHHQAADVCIDDPRFWDKLAGIHEPPIPEVIDVISGSDDTTNSEGGYHDDSVSLLSEIEVVKGLHNSSSNHNMKSLVGAYQIFTACHRHQAPAEDEQYHEGILVGKEDELPNDLYLHVSEEGGGGGETKEEEKHDNHDIDDNNDDSLAVSSFDSRMGDTRFMDDDEEEDAKDYKTKRVIIDDVYDDGSSYSSHYFRLGPAGSSQEPSEYAAMSSSAAIHFERTSWQTTSTRTTENMTNPSRYHRYDF